MASALQKFRAAPETTVLVVRYSSSIGAHSLAIPLLKPTAAVASPTPPISNTSFSRDAASLPASTYPAAHPQMSVSFTILPISSAPRAPSPPEAERTPMVQHKLQAFFATIRTTLLAAVDLFARSAEGIVREVVAIRSGNCH